MPYIGVSPQFGVRRVHTYTATANQTSFSGAGAEGATLSYKDSNFVDVYQNGVKLGDADYTATSGTAIVLAQGASVSDLVVVVVYDVFSAADTVSKADGGQFDGNVTMAGTLATTGNATFSGDIIKSTSGTSNFAAGVNAGNSIASGGNYNVVVGDEAGTALTTGDNNVAIGFEALKTEDTHGFNVAVGYQALKTLNAGQEGYHTAVGYLAGTAMTTAFANTVVGGLAGDAITEGNYNVAVGVLSLSAETLGSKNTAVGYETLAAQNFTSATDAYNTAVGFGAGNDITTGSLNTLIGANSGDALTTGTTNVALGYNSLGADTAGNRSTALGYNTLQNQNFSSSTDTYNTAVGFQAGISITTGLNNTIVGGQAGDSITTGNSNVAIGKSALAADTKGANNIAIGENALLTQNFTSDTNSYNIAIGSDAGIDLTDGQRNILIGGFAGDEITDADDCIAIGYDAGGGNVSGTTTGHDCISIGTNAGTHLTTGTGNICMGVNAGENLTTGQYNVFIGPTLNSAVSASYNVLLGPFHDLSANDGAHQICLGYALTCVGNNNFTFGNSSTDSNIAFGATSISAPSDERLKEEIQDETVGLNFINELRPVTFRWKKKKDVPDSMNEYEEGSEERVMNGKYNHGFIAQEVKQVIDKYDIKDGLGLWMESGSDGRQRLAEGELVPFLVKAIQDLSTKVTTLETENATQATQIADLISRVTALEKGE